MKQIFFITIALVFFIGCGGDGKLKVSGNLTKHNGESDPYLTIKDEKTGKIFRIAKESEVTLADKDGHKIKMAVKVLEKDPNAQGVDTVKSCTMCHHSIKEL